MKTTNPLLSAIACAAALILLPLGFSGTIHAGQPDTPAPHSQTLAPYFVILGDEGEGVSEPLPLKRTDVDVSIAGTIAEVEVRQTYHNTGSKTLEAIYVFPGSTRAAVHGLEMKIGERTVVAEIHEREEAKEKYEAAKAENKTAALLEQERPNVFKMQVGHILPGDLVEVTLHYTELLAPTDRVYEFVFPTVVGPRYSNTPVDSPKGVADAWVANPYLDSDAAEKHAADFDIAVRLKAGMPIQDASCASHPVRIDYAAADSAEIRLEPATDGIHGDRDFIFHYRLAGEQVAPGLLLHEDADRGENFFLLTVQPPQRIEPDAIPTREYLFVVDVSGSMNGFPLDTTKALLGKLIDTLRPSDRFNLMLFAADSRLLDRQSLAATQANLKRALKWLDGERGSGGTELTAALRRMLEVPDSDGTSRSIVVVTDGYVSFERETFDVVRNNLGDANLFSFGIGSSVNRFLIEGLARSGHGEPFVVTHPDDATAIAERFRDYISAPALTDIDLQFDGFDAYDIEPESIADVFADRPINIIGKYRGKAGGELKLSGVTGAGKKTLRVDIGELASSGVAQMENPALTSLWARQRVARLADDIELGAGDEAKLEVTNIGLTYRLLTEFTSFLAVDTEVREAPAGAEHETVKQPLPLPKGVSPHAVGGGSIPEPSMSLLLLLALLVLLLQRPRRAVTA